MERIPSDPLVLSIVSQETQIYLLSSMSCQSFSPRTSPLRLSHFEWILFLINQSLFVSYFQPIILGSNDNCFRDTSSGETVYAYVSQYFTDVNAY